MVTVGAVSSWLVYLLSVPFAVRACLCIICSRVLSCSLLGVIQYCVCIRGLGCGALAVKPRVVCVILDL